jgi:hypothetical protein
MNGGTAARTGIRKLAGGTILTGLIALLVAASPYAVASPVAKFHAPYTGATTFASNTTAKPGHCSARYYTPTLGSNSSSKLAIRPSANPSSGRVLGADSACAQVLNGAGTRSAGIQTSSGFIGPAFKFGSSGNRTVVYRWHIHWQATGSTVRGPHAGALVGANITLFGNVYDNTTARWVLGQDVAFVVYSHPLGSPGLVFNSNGSQNATLTLHMWLTGGDQYLFFTGLFTSVSVRAISACNSLCGGAWAFAVVNVGPSGHGAWVRSMQVA